MAGLRERISIIVQIAFAVESAPATTNVLEEQKIELQREEVEKYDIRHLTEQLFVGQPFFLCREHVCTN